MTLSRCGCLISSRINGVASLGFKSCGYWAGLVRFAQELLRFRYGGLRSGQETKNFIHHAVGLVRLKEKLRMSVAFQNYQLFRFRSLQILSSNPRQSRAVVVCIVACN